MTTPRREPVAIETGLGRIQGLRDAGVLAFRGIRYAQPPVAERRFLPPVAAGPWTGMRDATRFPDRCVQAAGAGLLGEPVGGTSEDCLFLNVVTPSVQGAHRPVLFWIHGGGFVSGSANEYDGAKLAAQGDVVVVTVNYRLGHFGFLDLSSLGEEFAGSASNGIRDQILALAWVCDHIADYGGDPGNVTIFGESAGGHSVLALLAAPAADRLYHRAIAHSPGVACLPSEDITEPLATHLGIARKSLVGRLRALSSQELLELQEAVPGAAGAVDGTVVTRSTEEAIAARGGRGVPLVAGSNRDEGALFTALLDSGAEPDYRSFARLLARGADPSPYIDAVRARAAGVDAIGLYERALGHVFLRAAMDSAAWSTAAGPGGWLYRFDLPTTVRWRGRELGATHGAEIPFTFNRYNTGSPGPLTLHDPDDPVVRDLSQRWSDTVIAFARTGDPNGAGLPDWPRYDGECRETLVLDAWPRVERDPDRAEREFWEGVPGDG